MSRSHPTSPGPSPPVGGCTLQEVNASTVSHQGTLSFPGGSGVKNLPANAGVTAAAVSIPGSGRFLGEGNGNPVQYSCLGNPTGRGAWWATVHGVTKVRHD